MHVHQALTEFVDKYCLHTNDGKRLTVFDTQWPSTCINGNASKDGDEVPWTPVNQNPALNFDNVEQALDIRLNDDIKHFFTHYFSENLPALAPEGECELLQAWNKDDFERLQENIIGHILMKRRLEQPVTVFFGLTDEDDFILSVDNATGQVMLEQVGCEPTRVLAANLADFLNALEPR